MELETRSFILFYLLGKYRFRHWTQEDIQAYQAKKMGRIVGYAVAKAPFYRRHYAGCDLEKIWALPTVNKGIMMANLSDFNTLGLCKEEIMDFCLAVERERDFSRRYKGLNIGMSSGTSGNKGVEITTPREEKYLRALFFSRFPFLKGEKINLAFILRVTVPAFAFKLGGHRLTYINQLQPLDRVVAEIQELQPNIISGPPSYLKLLAKATEQGQLAVRPRRLLSYAEVLYPDTKAYLEKLFGCPVHEIYKATEGAIAMSCSHGSLHINEDLLAVETLRADGSLTPPGEPCQRLVVTDLHKTSQPIIRYELNDTVTISRDKCPCGSNFRVVEQIQGRADDSFIAFDKSQQKQYIFPDFITRAIISVSDEIEEFQAVQKSLNQVVVLLQLAPDADQGMIADRVRQGVGEVFRKYDCPVPELELRFGTPEPNKNSQKFMRVRREYSDG